MQSGNLYVTRRIIRLHLGSCLFAIFLLLCSCGGADFSSTDTSNPTPKAATPNFARSGGAVHDFDLKFGKENTSNGGIGYQPFGSYTSGQDLPTDKVSISVENGHVEVVRVTLPKGSPLSWQDGTKFCQSFLPTDAVFQSEEDFSPPTQEYQELYMSKTMAHMFSADHFVAGNGINPQPLTLGTLQIIYYYSSWYNHTTSGAQITSCSIGLGEKL